MRDLAGKTAFITGGASGIGLAMGHAFATAGMNVMLADIETEALDAAVSNLCATAPSVRGIVCDVADYGSVERAAAATIRAFGKVHLVCNNAGVADSAGVDDISLPVWQWVMGVDLMGVVHGVKAFVPLIKQHGEGGHIVNTSSMTGLLPELFSPYVAAKSAVVGLTEALRSELAPSGIGASVLCPSFTNTRILDSARNWPTANGPRPVRDVTRFADRLAELMRHAMQPEEVAALVRKGVEEDQLYIFTQSQRRPPLEERCDKMLSTYRALK